MICDIQINPRWFHPLFVGEAYNAAIEMILEEDSFSFISSATKSTINTYGLFG